MAATAASAAAAASAALAAAEASFREAALPEAHPKRAKARGSAAIAVKKVILDI
jgi:hypothetical protein